MFSNLSAISAPPLLEPRSFSSLKACKNKSEYNLKIECHIINVMKIYRFGVKYKVKSCIRQAVKISSMSSQIESEKVLTLVRAESS